MKIQTGRIFSVCILAVLVTSAVCAESRIQFSPAPDQKALHTLIVLIEGTEISTAAVTDIYLDMALSEENRLKRAGRTPSVVG